ncbi:MAG: ABC transporter substrate-binding protein [archaeon]
MKKLNMIAIGLIIVLFAGCTQQNVKQGDPSIKNIKERGKLIVGTSTSYKPMEFYTENNEISGLDIDIAKEIASILGLPLEVKDFPVWEELLDSVSSGEIDFAISSITITPERSKKMLFSVPYLNGGQVIVTKSEANILFPEDIMDKKVAVISGSTSEQIATQYVKSPDQVIPYENYDPELNLLLNETVDAVIIDYVAAVDYVKSSSNKLKIVGEPITQEYYGAATKLGNDALMSEMNRILRNMKTNGKLDQIQKKWVQ